MKATKLVPEAVLPKRAHEDDAAFDLYSVGDTYIEAGGRSTVPTGIAVAIPRGFCGLIVGRSGLARDHGIAILGGLIDPGYRGEISVLLANLGDSLFYAPARSRIAQLLVFPLDNPDTDLRKRSLTQIEEVDSLDETTRGAGGFGSTGKD